MLTDSLLERILSLFNSTAAVSYYVESLDTLELHALLVIL
jgi:hypothetical protein